jgi:hypothetical protein
MKNPLETMTPKIGCVQHDCDKCKAMSAELEAAKADLWKQRVESAEKVGKLEADWFALQAKLSAIQSQAPVAWMDCFDNVNRVKYRGFNTPLYALPQVEQHASDDELPSMWSTSDFTGGSTECIAAPVQQPAEPILASEFEVTKKVREAAQEKMKFFNEMMEKKAQQPAPQQEQDAFETWLENTCPSGDVTEVQRQWEASYDFQEWMEQQAAQPVAQPAEPVGINGLTKAETDNSMSVRGLSKPTVQQPAEPLTGEQIMSHEMWRSHAGHSFREKLEITRAIEAAHGIHAKEKPKPLKAFAKVSSRVIPNHKP